MAEIDSGVAAILDASLLDDEDALIASLEDSPNTDAFREQRLQQLHAEFVRAKIRRSSGFGSYMEIKEEKELMDITRTCQYAVVHFANDGFARCVIMDRHLESLAGKHFDTRFLKINVNNAPFLVSKLKLRVLPCVLAFVNGFSVDRILGFDGLGDHKTPDNITTMGLEAKLLKSGVIQRAKTEEDVGLLPCVAPNKEEEEVEEDDWD